MFNNNSLQRAKGCRSRLTFAVPDRIIDGYGINEHLIDEAYNNGTDTIITCDNGIAAIEQIKYAKEKGMTVIVTDHHDIPFDYVDGEKIHKVPQADAIVILNRRTAHIHLISCVERE